MGKQMGVSLYELRKKWLKKADLTSDMFAAVVFEDYLALQDVLRILTGIADLKVTRVISKNNQRVDNGVHEIYANLEYPAERDDVARLLDFVKDTNRVDVDTRGFEHLANRVYELKNEGEGVRKMCEWSEWERSEGRKEGRKEGWMESQIECVLEILEEYGTVPDGLRKMIESQEDIGVLRSWMRAAIKSHSIEEFEERVSLVVR